MKKTALILFAHGARDPEWALPIQRVCSAVSAQAPDLRDCAELLVTEGVERIVVLPMFIAQGGHLKRDVPILLEELRGRYPQIRFEQACPIGEAESIVQAMAAHVLTLSGETVSD